MHADDNSRVHWTLFGGSEHGPERAFWRSFFTSPGCSLPDHAAAAFFQRLLQTVYGEPERHTGNLRECGFRILLNRDARSHPETLPPWTESLLWSRQELSEKTRYLLTFAPFGELPLPVRRAYLAGRLHLIPFPGSLIFWGAPQYYRLAQQLPLALQIPLLLQVERFEGNDGIRTPQAGWFHEPSEQEIEHPHGRLRHTYQRTQRHPRSARHADTLEAAPEVKLVKVLFSTSEGDIGLYNKPPARNVQIWTHDFQLLLNGPTATPEDLKRARAVIDQGGLFGYRFQFPAMQVGRHELYWHRPLAAYWVDDMEEPAFLAGAPLGHLLARLPPEADSADDVELWPRLLRRELHIANVELFGRTLPGEQQYQTLRNVAKLLDVREALGWALLPRAFARSLLTVDDKRQTLEAWLDALPERVSDKERCRWLIWQLYQQLENAPASSSDAGPALTFAKTARRSFEVGYWKTIAYLSEGKYANKNNADCILDSVTQAALNHHGRDLEALGDHLLEYYSQIFRRQRATGQTLLGEIPFRWETSFEFPWMEGWLRNQQGNAYERNLMAVIPGRDRNRAIVLADHYDTAYREDRYEKGQGGDGARLAAPGADDNGSATAALLLAAPIFLELSRRRHLGCDVWLVHLTGEEFPAEGLGANRLCERLIEGNLRLRTLDGGWHDLSAVKVEALVLLDMIGHNTRQRRDVFRICPGASPESLALAFEAHQANESWNRGTWLWNRRPLRRGLGRARRSRRADKIPEMAAHLRLQGEVRPPDDPASTLYNSDGQVMSDAGVPVILLMENYDIERSGYHDSHDTLANINLDYGAALAAIAIETVARLSNKGH